MIPLFQLSIMAPQQHIPQVSTILGSIGTFCWTVQILPQIWWVFKHRQTDQNLKWPALMYFLWALNAAVSGVYAIVQNFNRALWAQAEIFIGLALICLFQALLFQHRWSWKASLGTTLLCMTCLGFAEAVLIIFVQWAYKKGSTSAIDAVGITGAVLIGAGLLPPLYNNAVAKGKNVSLSWPFLAIDFAGAAFSLASLATQNAFDPLGAVPYIVCMCFHTTFVVMHLFWLIRARVVAARESSLSTLIAERPIKLKNESRAQSIVNFAELGMLPAAVSSSSAAQKEDETPQC